MTPARRLWCSLLLWPVVTLAHHVVPTAASLTLGEPFMEYSYHSTALGKEQLFTVVQPVGSRPARGWPVLFLLHGHGRNHRTLIDNPATRALLRGRGYLIILPDTGGGWYVDSPVNSSSRYGQAFDELFRLASEQFHLSSDRHDRAIAGWSMGGFGAMYHAGRTPGRFGFAGSMIGLLDFPRSEGLPENQRYRIPEQIFGPDPAVWRQFNPTTALRHLERTKLFIVVAAQAFDRTMNENFICQARARGIKPRVTIIEGRHTFASVTAALPLLLRAVSRHLSDHDKKNGSSDF